MASTYTLIACLSENNGIGLEGRLLYQIKADMAQFRDRTFGASVIMGRKTWESLPNNYRPLPLRQNIVISSNPDYVCGGARLALDLHHALSLATSRKIFVIGGEKVYREAIAGASEMILTHVSGKPQADTFFPTFDKRAYKTKILDCGEQDGVEFIVRQYTRKAVTK